MGNCRSIKGHRDQRLLGGLDAFPDRIRDLVGFPETRANTAFAVAHYND